MTNKNKNKKGNKWKMKTKGVPNNGNNNKK